MSRWGCDPREAAAYQGYLAMSARDHAMKSTGTAQCDQSCEQQHHYSTQQHTKSACRPSKVTQQAYDIYMQAGRQA